MKIVRVDKFPDNKLLADVLLKECRLKICKTGKARYQLICMSNEDRCIVDIWTSEKGLIETCIIPNEFDRSLYSLDPAGNIQELSCFCESIHLEHMDRGFYVLCIDVVKTIFIIHFTTRGYLKTSFKQT